jgi:hypothetical protein
MQAAEAKELKPLNLTADQRVNFFVHLFFIQVCGPTSEARYMRGKSVYNIEPKGEICN